MLSWLWCLKRCEPNESLGLAASARLQRKEETKRSCQQSTPSRLQLWDLATSCRQSPLFYDLDGNASEPPFTNDVVAPPSQAAKICSSPPKLTDSNDCLWNEAKC